jgi:hypothetical protein
MEAGRFDALARTLTRGRTRRRALAGLLAGALGILGTHSDDAAAKNKKPCPPCKKRKKGKCKANAPDGTACAGGTCQSGRCVAAPPSGCASGCPAYAPCTNGQCLCNPGLQLCGQECIPTIACCTDAECGTVPCIGHTCFCFGRGDGTDCGGGKQCSGGVCAKRPLCTAGFGLCVNDTECCSVSCLPVLGAKHCSCVTGGRQCQGGDCCPGLTCVGFVCQ